MTIAKHRKFVFISLLVFIVGIISFLIMTKTKLLSYDFWWHIKTGEWIMQNGKIPTSDIFSWYGMENNLSWMSHEWLSAIVMYVFTILFGVDLGGWLFAFSCIMLIFICLFLFNKRRFENNAFFAVIWLIIGIIIFRGFINPRPFLISYILIASTIFLCETLRKNENSKLIYLLPLISLLWVNFHGGSSNLVYIIPLCYLVPNLFNIKLYRLQNKKLTNIQIKKYIIAIAFVIIAMFINPHGVNMILYPYVNMLDSTLQAYISEWRAIDLKVDIVYGLFVFFILFVGIFTKKDLRITDCIMLFFFIFLSLRSVRFVPVLYIAASFYIFYYIKPIIIKKTSPVYWYEKHGSLILLLSSLFVFCLAVYILFANQLFTNNNIEIKKLISDDVIVALKENNYERIYNTYGLGGFLIFNDIEVFIDGRADMYSNNIFLDAMNMEHISSNLNEKFEKYKFDAFIIDKKSSLYNYFISSEKYKLIIEDENVALYER